MYKQNRTKIVSSHDKVVYNNTEFTYHVSVVGAEIPSVVSFVPALMLSVVSFVPAVRVVVANISAPADTLSGTGGGAMTIPLSCSETVVRTSQDFFFFFSCSVDLCDALSGYDALIMKRRCNENYETTQHCTMEYEYAW